MEDSWIKICNKLKRELGKNAYKNWIEPINFVKIEDCIAIFDAPTSFIGNWVQRNYGDLIIDNFIQLNIKIDRLKFISENPNSSIPNKLENNSSIFTSLPFILPPIDMKGFFLSIS